MIQSHYLTDESTENDVIKAALAELVSQQARVLATNAGKGRTYEVEAAMKKLVRIDQVRADFVAANRGW